MGIDVSREESRWGTGPIGHLKSLETSDEISATNGSFVASVGR
jgi:hypothetical protein